MPKKDDFLNERTRAEDIILGSLGYDTDAKITHIELSDEGFKGVACWDDGETFEFESDFELTELEIWAVNILSKNL